MGPQPGAQQRPEAFQGVDVHLAEAVAIVVPGVFAAAMTDRLVTLAPGFQTRVDIVLVGVDQAITRYGRLDDRPDGRLLHIGQHVHDHLAAALDQAEERRLFLFQRAAAGRAFKPTAPSGPPFLVTATGFPTGFPLCPATT